MIPGRQRPKRIGEQFVSRRVSMLHSPAYRALSLGARRVLDRIEIEHMAHGGVENGKLPVPYVHFEEYGLHKDAIAPAIRESVALGFLEITEPGRAGNAEFRRPALYRLTYLHTGRAGPTDEWRRINNEQDAHLIAKAARNASTKKQKSAPGFRPVSPPVSMGIEAQSPPPDSMGTVSPPNSMGTSRYRDPAALQVVDGGQPKKASHDTRVPGPGPILGRRKGGIREMS